MSIVRPISQKTKSLLKRLVRRHTFEVPEQLRRNYRQVDEAGLAALRESIASNYHVGWRAREKYPPEKYLADVRSHLHRRLDADRNNIIPWLDTLKPLKGLKVLEIGCGTGSSTVALAEQGAVVTGIDIDKGALCVAHDRCRIYRVSAALRVLNAANIEDAFSHSSFDLIVFYASLEHMTVQERLTALSCAWRMLPFEGMLGVIETPNRLWFCDVHTSLLPFFHWLPNDLAFQYAQFSPRENFRELYHKWTPLSEEHFLRRGRGVSCHEFDLAIGPVRDPCTIGGLSAFRQRHGILQRKKGEKTYIELLLQQCPEVPPPFFEKQLDLVIEKQGPTDMIRLNPTRGR